MNVRQYEIMFDAFEVCRQIVYENENGIKPEEMTNKIVYLKNLIQEFDKWDK
jgi:hypothetical protein